MNSDIIMLICEFCHEPPRKLRDFLREEDLIWSYLSENPAAIDLLRVNPEKIDWWELSGNPAAIPLLVANPEKINWSRLSSNPAATGLLEANPGRIDPISFRMSRIKIDAISSRASLVPNWSDEMLNVMDWYTLSSMSEAIEVIKSEIQKPDSRVNMGSFSRNPRIFEVINPTREWFLKNNAGKNGDIPWFSDKKLHLGALSANPAIFEIDFPKWRARKRQFVKFWEAIFGNYIGHESP